MLDKSQIGVVCKTPRANRELQITKLREAGAQWIVEIGKNAKSWREVVREVHPGDTVRVYALSSIPTKRGDDELSPSAQVADFLIEVHERGGTVVEVLTGRNSRDRKARRGMIADAQKAIKRGSRALPPTGRGRGRPKTEWPADDVAKAKAVWFSRDYVSNVAASKHLPKGMTAKRAWQLFGASGRPYKSKRK